MRRAIALLLGGFMLVLNYERADVACAKHSVKQPATAHQHHASQANHQTSSEKDCATPTEGDCCSALATCSIVLGFDESIALESVAAHVHVAARLDLAPQSRIATPEPPPPRV